MSNGKHVVFLLHGIRTQGEWAQRAAAALEADPIIRARPIRYEFFDVLRFLLPFSWLREQPVRRVARLIRDELTRKPESISIVAHSFGTYIVAKLLESETDIYINRVLLCGSIVPDDFDWGRYGHRLGSDKDGDWQVVNDCGMRDVWPVLAKSVTWGYGSSGRFGFGNPRVKDRFFDMGHSGFFGEGFIKEYWLPYLSEGNISGGVLSRPTNAWWVSLLTVIKIRNIFIFSIFASLVFFGASPISAVLKRSGLTTALSSTQVPPVDEIAVQCRQSLTWSAEYEASILSSYASEVDPAPRVFCQQLLFKSPDDKEANGLFARSLIMEGRLEEAIARLERAAKLGDMHSDLVLGYYYLLWRETDRGRGVSYLEAAAQKGSGEALFALGKYYEIKEINFKKAAEYYQAASKAGLSDADFRLGQLYEWGLGVQKDIPKAKELYRSAAGVGSNEAVEALNALSKRN